MTTTRARSCRAAPRLPAALVRDAGHEIHAPPGHPHRSTSGRPRHGAADARSGRDSIVCERSARSSRFAMAKRKPAPRGSGCPVVDRCGSLLRGRRRRPHPSGAGNVGVPLGSPTGTCGPRHVRMFSPWRRSRPARVPRAQSDSRRPAVESVRTARRPAGQR